MDGSLTGASESDVDKQQLTARVPLNGCPRGLTPNFSAAMEDCNLDAVKRPSCRIYHTPKTGRVVGLPLSKYSRAQHRTLLSAFQRRAAPRSMAFTKVTTQAAHLCESRRPGAAASRFWAAAGVSSGLVDGVKAPCPISKLPEIEARTVEATPEREHYATDGGEVGRVGVWRKPAQSKRAHEYVPTTGACRHAAWAKAWARVCIPALAPSLSPVKTSSVPSVPRLGPINRMGRAARYRAHAHTLRA